MANFHKLNTDDVTAMNVRKPRHDHVPVDLTEYMAVVNDTPVGDGLEVTLADGESKRTVKHRLTHAARLSGKNVKWMRSSGNELKAVVTTSN